MARVLFVTGSDSTQFSLAYDCIQSIREKATGTDHDIAFLDLGCSAEQRERVVQLGCVVREACWEFGIRNSLPQAECRKGQMCRPFLPEYFPDHELFFWIDADAWIQDSNAISLFVEAASTRGAGLVPELERSSKFFHGGLEAYLASMARLYRVVYGDAPAASLYHHANLNAGVFCFHRDSPLWAVWKECLAQTLKSFFREQRTVADVLSVFGLIDQIALNVGIRQQGLESAVEMLPATCNWTCHLSLPAYDERRGLFVEPHLPHAPLGVVHLTNPWGGSMETLPHAHERRSRRPSPSVQGKQFYAACRVETVNGGAVARSLLWPGRGTVRQGVNDAEPTAARDGDCGTSGAPVYDYVATGLETVWPDGSFPHMVEGNPDECHWAYLRRGSPHRWYVDRRHPTIGFVSRDEAAILYSSAKRFAGRRALEIGCWQGWSACHLAAAHVALDVIDPILMNPVFRPTIEQSLRRFGVHQHVVLHGLRSPDAVDEVAEANGEPWSLFFIDGDHDGDAVVRDTVACLPHAAPDCLILYHDLMSPDVASALVLLREKGWNTMVYLTSQIMGVAWRGDVSPVRHRPDVALTRFPLPAHLDGFQVSRG